MIIEDRMKATGVVNGPPTLRVGHLLRSLPLRRLVSTTWQRMERPGRFQF